MKKVDRKASTYELFQNKSSTSTGEAIVSLTLTKKNTDTRPYSELSSAHVAKPLIPNLFTSAFTEDLKLICKPVQCILTICGQPDARFG